MADRVVVVGSVNMDMVVRLPRLPVAGETLAGSSFAMIPGGKGANQAVAAARSGAPTAIVGRVGNDELGRRLRRGLDGDGVDVTRLRTDPEVATGVAVVQVDDRGENAIVVVAGANGRAQGDDAAGAFAGAGVCLLQGEIPGQVLLGAARLAREAGCAVFLDPAPPDGLPAEIWPLCALVLPNAREAEALTGIAVTDAASAQAAGQALLAKGARAALVKMGAAGAVLVTATATTPVAAFAVEPVDTTAAGDCMAGALAAARVGGASLAEAAEFGAAAAALSVTRAGAQPSLPTREETLRFLRGRRGAM
jgi:ribokinase